MYLICLTILCLTFSSYTMEQSNDLTTKPHTSEYVWEIDLPTLYAFSCTCKQSHALFNLNTFLLKNPAYAKSLQSNDYTNALIHYAKQNNISMFKHIVENENYLNHENRWDILEEFENPYRCSYEDMLLIYNGEKSTPKAFFKVLESFLSNPTTHFYRFYFKLNPNINIQDAKGNTPLHYACIKDNYWLIHFLLNHPNKIKVNIQNKDNRTPLHESCYSNSGYAIDALLKHPDINVNLQDKEGNTPLHIAYRKSSHSFNYKIITKLTEHPSIDTLIKNKSDKIPCELYIRNLDVNPPYFA